MKKFLVLFFTLLCFNSFSQMNNNDDSTEICFPYTVGQQILLDLNDYDRTKELLKLSKNEIDTLELKIEKQEGIINFYVQRDTMHTEIIKYKDEKFKLVDEENKNLRNDIHNLKTKNTIIEIVAGGIITGLVYIFAFK